MALQPHPEEEQARVRDPRGALDPAAHPQADAEVSDAQQLEKPGIPSTLAGPSLPPEPPGSLSLLSQNLQERPPESAAAATAGSTVLPLEKPHPVLPSVHIQGVHGYEFLVGQQ